MYLLFIHQISLIEKIFSFGKMFGYSLESLPRKYIKFERLDLVHMINQLPLE